MVHHKFLLVFAAFWLDRRSTKLTCSCLQLKPKAYTVKTSGCPCARGSSVPPAVLRRLSSLLEWVYFSSTRGRKEDRNSGTTRVILTLPMCRAGAPNILILKQVTGAEDNKVRDVSSSPSCLRLETNLQNDWGVVASCIGPWFFVRLF